MYDRDALSFVNAVRRRHHLRPIDALPRGEHPSPAFPAGRSPVEVALNVKVVLGHLQADTPTGVILLDVPDPTARFIERWREGGYPPLNPPIPEDQ